MAREITMIDIAQKITEKIHALEKGRGVLAQRGEEKARTISDYSLAMSVATIKLKAEGTQATLIRDLAKGLCSEAEYKMLVAESAYKNAVIGMSSLEAELNGYQSVNRYLQHEV